MHFHSRKWVWNIWKMAAISSGSQYVKNSHRTSLVTIYFLVFEFPKCKRPLHSAGSPPLCLPQLAGRDGILSIIEPAMSVKLCWLWPRYDSDFMYWYGITIFLIHITSIVCLDNKMFSNKLIYHFKIHIWTIIIKSIHYFKIHSWNMIIKWTTKTWAKHKYRWLSARLQ